MGKNSQTEYIQKKFGHCVINWKIENFCIMASCNQCLFIASPEFYINGPHITKWSMAICPNWNNNGTSHVCFRLKYLDCEGKANHLQTSWKLWLLDSKRNCLYVGQSNSVFEKNKDVSVTLCPTQDVLKKLCPFESDTLNLRYRLIFKSSTDLVIFEKSRDIGLNALSEELKMLKNSEHTNISITVKNQSIPTHKAILCARNNCLADIIHKSPNKKMIELPDIHYEAMEMVIAYFYSGDLEFVVSKPTIALYDCISLLNIDEVKSYYIADELIVYSTILVEEIEFLWAIPNFSTRSRDCILSPVLNSGISDTNWRLGLYPRGIQGYDEYMSFSVEVVGGTNSLIACVETAITDEKGELFRKKRIRKLITDDNALRLEDFAKWEDFENSSLLANDKLRIIVKIRTPNSLCRSSLGSCMLTKITSSKTEDSYNLLSMNMDFLFRNMYYADITLQCEAVEFNAHSCILAARSPILAEFTATFKNKIIISNIKPKIMYIVLRYIYNGVLRDFEPCDLRQIKKAADNLGILILKNTCTQIMQSNDIQNNFIS